LTFVSWRVWCWRNMVQLWDSKSIGLNSSLFPESQNTGLASWPLWCSMCLVSLQGLGLEHDETGSVGTLADKGLHIIELFYGIRQLLFVDFLWWLGWLQPQPAAKVKLTVEQIWQRILEGEFDVWQSFYLMISYPAHSSATTWIAASLFNPAAQCLLVHRYGGCRICLQSDKIIHCNLLVCSMKMWWNLLMTPLLASLHFFIQDFLRKREPASGLSLQTIWPHGSQPTSWHIWHSITRNQRS
jgi:hypothetical protein